MTLSHPSKADATPQAPLQIELRFVLHLPSEAVFDLVAFRLPEWFGEIHAVQWDHSRSEQGSGLPGACSERACDFGGKVLREQIVAFEPGRRYAYRADLDRSDLKMPLSGHLGTFEIEDVDGGSLVTWRQYFHPRWFVPAGLLRRQMRDRMMRPAVEGLIARHGGRWMSLRPSGAA